MPNCRQDAQYKINPPQYGANKSITHRWTRQHAMLITKGSKEHPGGHYCLHSCGTPKQSTVQCKLS
jgi:hypothetical protein